VRNSYKRLTEHLSNKEKIDFFEKIIAEIAKRDEDVATQLKSAYKAGSSSKCDAAKKFIEDFHLLLITFKDVGRLKCQLQREANERSDWARVLLGNAQLVTESVAT